MKFNLDDANLYCKECQKFISIYNLKHHRLYHCAIDTCKFSGSTKTSLKAIIKAKQIYLEKMMNSKDKDIKNVRMFDKFHSITYNENLDNLNLKVLNGPICNLQSHIGNNHISVNVLHNPKIESKNKKSFSNKDIINYLKSNRCLDRIVVDNFQCNFLNNWNCGYANGSQMFDGISNVCEIDTNLSNMQKILVRNNYSVKNFKKHVQFGFFAMFTGKSINSIKYCSQNCYPLFKKIFQKYSKVNDNINDGHVDTKRIVFKTFRKLHILLDKNIKYIGYDSTKCILPSSSCTFMCFINFSTLEIYSSNLGDVSAISVNMNGSITQLSVNHNYKNKLEQKRIKTKGGHFSESRDNLVNNFCSTTRCLGNYGWKNLRSLTNLKCSLRTFDYKKNKPNYIVIASNSFWQIFSKNEVKSLVDRMLPNGKLKNIPLQTTEFENFTKKTSSLDMNSCSKTLDKEIELDAQIHHYSAMKRIKNWKIDKSKSHDQNEPNQTKTKSKFNFKEDINLAKEISKNLIIFACLGGCSDTVNVAVILCESFSMALNTTQDNIV
ncbi:hypothetical protein A3Q56_03493 [Intoshia linei]|uniref:PPM-type phosphatase domain-containing protein n=1 Tax=Intoshia linei TaxID=1819745 RepID=A0A177B3N0_9BILA|nr:hypothetical protein A3Q56_03493 [Intoshia linei]